MIWPELQLVAKQNIKGCQQFAPSKTGENTLLVYGKRSQASLAGLTFLQAIWRCSLRNAAD